jgi:hypothetical protein
MRLLDKSIAVFCLSCGIVLAGGVPAASATNGAFQEGYNDRGPEALHDLIGRTQADIRRAESFERGEHHQRERCRDAEQHLSTLDRHLTKGHFDKGELDHSIGDVQGILDHNTLQAADRDALLRDVEDLRVARDRR